MPNIVPEQDWDKNEKTEKKKIERNETSNIIFEEKKYILIASIISNFLNVSFVKFLSFMFNYVFEYFRFFYIFVFLFFLWKSCIKMEYPHIYNVVQWKMETTDKKI